MAQIKFVRGTREQYNALIADTSKKETDKNRIPTVNFL